VHQDPNENFPPANEKNPHIIDTVAGIGKPIMIDLSDLRKIDVTPVSPHDYDLLFHLLLLKKLKKIDSAVIYGIPLGVTMDKKYEIIKWLKQNI